MSLVVTNCWRLYQLDVKNVFLHVDLTKEVYVATTLVCYSRGSVESLYVIEIFIWIEIALGLIWTVVVQNLACKKVPVVMPYVLGILFMVAFF